MWMEGNLSVEDHAIHVQPSDGKRRQTYKLFDHVTVTIQLSNRSDVHARSLAFYLLPKRSSPKSDANNKKPGNKSEDLNISKMDFLQEIKKDQQKMEQEQLDKDKFEENPQEKSKSKEKEMLSMYRFFEDMKTMGETAIVK